MGLAGWKLRISIATLLVALAAAGVAMGSRFTYGNGVELAAGEMGGASVECPSGWLAHWGGYFARFGGDGGAEATAFKTRGNGWRLLATNTAKEERGISIEAYCQPGRRPLVQRDGSARVAPLSTGAATARCRRGETLLAGGFRASIEPGGPRVTVDGMRRVGARNLRVTAANVSRSAPGLLTAYAYCGHAKRPVVGRGSEVVPPGEATRLVAACPDNPRDWNVIFGGFQASPGDPVTGSVTSPAQFRPGGKGKIIVTAVNRSQTEPATMTAFVYCR
jgi:hypothetical protein